MAFSDWLTLIGLMVTVAGFTIAIWQIRRTANASKAAADALMRSQRQIEVNYLLVLLPQFRIVESDLDAAVTGDDRRLAMRALRNYSTIAAEVSALLVHQSAADPSLLQALKESAMLASQTKAELVNNASKKTKNVTNEFRQRLGEILASVGGLAAQFTVGVPHA